MKKILHITQSIMLVVTGMLFLTTCISDNNLTEVEVGEDDGTVKLEIFTRSNSYDTPSTRVSADENGVDKAPWIIVFKGTDGNATFVEAVQAVQFTGIDNKIYVILKEQPGTACQLLILANNQSNFSANGTSYLFNKANLTNQLNGKKLSEACNLLLTEPLNSQETVVPFIGKKLTMSYLLPVNAIDKNTEIGTTTNPLRLIRTVAKIIVRNTSADFTLKGITVTVNVAGQGQWHNLTPAVIMNSTGLSEYRTGNINTDIALAVTVTGGQATDANPVYVYESQTAADDSYIIIRGTYMGKDYFYKMALVDNDLNILSIYRNNEYIFTITSVKGPGFESIGDAKAASPSNTNLNYQIFVNDDYAYEIITNNDYYMGVTNSHYTAYYTGGNDELHAFTVSTNCTNNFPDVRTVTTTSAGLQIVAPADGKIPITTNKNTPVGYDVKVRMANTFTEGTIELRLGNLKKTVTLKRADPVASAGVTISSFITGGYYLSAYLQNTSDISWMKFSPASGIVREDASIITDDGNINLHILTNTTSVARSGIVYVMTTKGSESKRIKLYISQN